MQHRQAFRAFKESRHLRRSFQVGLTRLPVAQRVTRDTELISKFDLALSNPSTHFGLRHEVYRDTPIPAAPSTRRHRCYTLF